MSTRSQILFKKTDRWIDKTGDEPKEHTRKHRLLTYKHSDGYPSGVVPLLQEYHKWNPRRNQFDYYTATWFYFVKRQMEEHFCDGANPTEKEKDDYNSIVLLGLGIDDDNQIHGDIEHFYIVDLDEERIAHYEMTFGNDYEKPEDIIKNNQPDNQYDLGGDFDDRQDN